MTQIEHVVSVRPPQRHTHNTRGCFSNQVVMVVLYGLAICGGEVRFQPLVGFHCRLYSFSTRDQVIIMNKGVDLLSL